MRSLEAKPGAGDADTAEAAVDQSERPVLWEIPED
jgi:hypothetical protein